MPKSREDTARLRQMRMKASKQKSSISPSEIYLTVLGNGAAGSPRCLYMFTDHSRYIFNCGEGTQRLAHEYKMKLSKLEHVFITHNSWENLGGLLGLSLTIQDIGVPRLTIHGPPNVTDVYSCSRPFVVTKELLIDKKSFEDEPFTDNCMQVQYVPVFSSKPKCHSISENGQSDSTDEISQVPKRLKISDDENIHDVAVSYICKGHNKKGHLMLDKCIELKVPSGPLLGELKNGKDVTLPSGKIVCSADVTSPDEPCPVFLVVECPSNDFLESFVTHEKFSELQTPDTLVSLIVHFTPHSVVSHCKYQEWMNRFPDSTCHLMLNDCNATVNSLAIHRVQHMLNLLHPEIYSLLHEYEIQPELTSNNRNIQAKTLCRYSLRPHNRLDRTSEVQIEPEAYIEEARNTTGFVDALNTLHANLEKHSILKEECYPEVAFLGTGSSLPSKVRNVSGIHINISNDCSMFMDCGEGSFNQLMRLYGAEKADAVIRNVKCIFISHLHADHHLGLFLLLKKRKAAFDAVNESGSPVIIIGPYCINYWLMDYDRHFESLATLYRFIDSSLLLHDRQCVSYDNELFDALQSVQVSTVPVQHCPHAYGCLLTLSEKWKIVYSGDTIPCQQLVDAGKDCTLLIHEATMEDDLEDEAALKMHSTTSQAINIAEQMNAKYTILTHFSQRYAKVPIFSDRFHGSVGCAFDNMKVRMCDLPIISLFNEPLQILFAENVEKLMDKTNKRKDKIKLAQANDTINAINTI